MTNSRSHLRRLSNNENGKRFAVSVWKNDKPSIILIVDKSNWKSVVTIINEYVYEDKIKSITDVAETTGHRILWFHYKIEPSVIVNKIDGINQIVKNPVNGKSQNLSSVIMDLNDTAGWSREQIADWLDTLDNQPKFSGIISEGSPDAENPKTLFSVKNTIPTSNESSGSQNDF